METYEFLKNPDPVKNLHFYNKLFKKHCKGYTIQTTNNGDDHHYNGSTYDKITKEFTVSIWFSERIGFNVKSAAGHYGTMSLGGAFSSIEQQYKYDWTFTLKGYQNMIKEFDEIAPIVKLKEVI